MRISKRFNVTIFNLLIDQCSIPWVKEIRYLGVYIVAAKRFKCNLHYARLQYFRSISGILGKVGSSAPVGLTLSLIISRHTILFFIIWYRIYLEAGSG